MSSRIARRLPARVGLAALAVLTVVMAGCAGLGLVDPLSVNVVGLEPMQGEGMETRFALKLRVQNPNETPLEYDGVFVEFDVRGSKLASGVSDRKGVVPRFGEAVITVPMSVSVGAMIRQVIGIATGERVRTDYQLRGKLAGPGFGGHRFESKGEVQLPAGLFGDER
ncbi:MAG TPA: LEA type 2 family protein [Burkholderiaceae bacterium]|jgi:LEA14-like dessication related protein|nr:LEA type 2 family protein [Zeimonas sp.]HQY28958.1 LEA type 2 family protein [Burkholderiaceae bacterium]HRA77750.1 LEA type 2 family protein [Burkholderiaceae bacterium]